MDNRLMNIMSRFSNVVTDLMDLPSCDNNTELLQVVAGMFQTLIDEGRIVELHQAIKSFFPEYWPADPVSIKHNFKFSLN